jgi:hypothetical protein
VLFADFLYGPLCEQLKTNDYYRSILKLNQKLWQK